jgi:serine/threonine-protein kinase
MSPPLQNNPWIDRLLGEGDRYRILRPISTGGMGEVFLVIDTKLNQSFALKVLKESLAKSQEMYQRFKREVDLCAALNSEHIIHFVDSGTTPEGFPFYVMEYLEGQSLGQLLQRQKRLPVERTVEIIKQACTGLQLAHAGVTLGGEHVKIVHRDLKPDNIFLVPKRWGELVKILDFGIAKKIRHSSSLDGNTIVTNMFLGTYRYAAPEQLALLREIDGRADIYSLGIIFYRMLSGTDPFGLRSELRPIGDVAWMKAHTSLREQPLRSLAGCEQISPQLEALVLKCLQKSPGDRFASMADLNQAIDAAISVSPVDVASTTSNTIVQTRPPTAGSDTPTVARQAPLPALGSDNPTVARQAPLPALGSDTPTVARQITPAAEPEINEPITIARIPAAPESIGQPNCDDGEISDQTIYQEVASPAPTQPDQTMFQGIALPRPNQPQQTSDRDITSPASAQSDQTMFQGVPSPRRNQPDQTMFQGVPSPTPDEVDRTIYQRPSLLTRLRRMSRQFERVTFQSIVSLIRKIGRSLRKIQSWIRSRRFRL